MTWNAHVAYAAQRLTFAAHLENLANADYLDVAGKPVQGRGLSIFAAWH